MRRMLAAALLAGSLLFTPVPARSEPITLSILSAIGVTGLSATAVSAITIVGSLALSVGLNYVAGLLTKKPANTSAIEKGVQSSVTLGGDVPRSAIVGRQATAGHLVYVNTYGQDNALLQMVFAIGDGRHDSLAGLYVGGKPVTLGAGGAFGTIINEFVDSTSVPHMWAAFFPGTETQGVNASLVAGANPAGRWTNDDTLAGICYVTMTMQFDEKQFTGGIPQFLFDVKGQWQYDWRKDSTNGGSGTHRWSDPSTWEWSDNPAVCLYNYQRGLWLNSELVLGEGLSPLDFVLDAYTAAANACDESVALKEGGTEKRYRIGFQVSADRPHRENIQDYLLAMAGTMSESAGSFAPQAGVTQPIALSFTDADLIIGQPVKYAAKRSRAELINAIFGTYSDPSQNWQAIAFPPRTSSADESADGERLARNVDYPMIFSPSQAQRVGEIERRLSRYQATATVPLPFKFMVLEPSDWVQWTSTRFNGVSSTTKTFQVGSGARRNEDGTITLPLREIAAQVFAWTPAGDQLDPQVPGDLPGTGTQITTISGFTLTGTTSFGANGVKQPAIRVQWVPVTDRTVTGVLVECRVQGSPNIRQIPPFPPTSGDNLIDSGLQAGTIYELRATIETEPPRTTTYTSWTAVTAGSEHVVPVAQMAGGVAPDVIGLASFKEELRDFVTTELSRFDDARQRAEQLIAAHAAGQDAGNWIDLYRRRRAASLLRNDLETLKFDVTTNYATNDAVATAKSEAIFTAGANADEAFAEYNLTVQTTYTTQSATATAKAEAVATALSNTNEAIAAYDVTVHTTFTTQSATAIAKAEAVALALTNTNEAIATYNLTVQATYGTKDNVADAKAQAVASALTNTNEAIATYNLTVQATYATPANVSTAKSEAISTATANADAAVAAFNNSVTTSYGNLSASVVQSAAAVVTVSGEVASMWQVSVTGDETVGGIKLGTDGATTFFDVEATAMRFGYSPAGMPFETLFQIQNVAGSARLTFKGDLFADGNLTARMVTVGEFITLSAQIRDAVIRTAHIGNLQVDTLQLADNAITVPASSSASSIATASNSTATLLSISMTVRQIAGKNTRIYAILTGTFALTGASGTGVNFYLYINNVQAAILPWSNGNTTTLPIAISGDAVIAGTGADQSIPVRVDMVHTGGGTASVGDRTLFSQATKR